MGERSKFAGGDQTYLRDEQYRDATRLAQRANLHVWYSTATTPWFDWVVSHFQLFDGARVLEAGCGAGWLWEQTQLEIPADIDLTLSDLSPGMVTEAVDRVVATGRFASVTGRPADLQSLPMTSESFDRIVANHMLYHLPEPARGVAELARVVRTNGIVVAATNGRDHMRELWEVRAAVFGTQAIDSTIDVFGTDVGFELMRRHFHDVRWLRHDDQLRCTDRADVVAYVCSTPPGEDATPEQQRRLDEAIDRAFHDGNGTMIITKDSGCFVCRRPRR